MLSWFARPGVYFIVDGQFGSTGKGAAAAWLYNKGGKKPQVYTTNNSPNAGHTGWHEGVQIITRHLSIGGIIDSMSGGEAITYLNSGAIIDLDLLNKEIEEWGMKKKIKISPKATIILPRHKENFQSLSLIASTQKGTGPAMADRIMRLSDVVVGGHENWRPDFNNQIVSCEVPQGFSLGLHSGFYPYTTNRECTVLQAAADLGCSHKDIRKVMMTLRTFPIRVGNTDNGYSGPCYPDQEETTWERIGVTPELTTVTKRVRRVFTFSWTQFRMALRANCPDALWVGFMDYLDKNDGDKFIHDLTEVYMEEMGKFPLNVIASHGPRPEQVEIRL